TLKNIEYYKSILSSNKVLMGIIREELIEIKDKYGDERRTVIEADTEELLIEDLIPDSETVVTITHNGYIKRTLLSSFTSQRRGGKGKSATLSKGDDFVQKLILSTNHSKLLFFTNKGRIHFLKTYELPESAPGTRGRHIANLLSLESDEYIASAISVNESTKDKCIFMCTKYGTVKKVDIEQFKSGRSGMIAIKLKEGDEIIGSELTSDEDNIILATKKGKTLQFSSKDVRPMGRNAVGVKGISLSKDDRVVSMEVISGHPFILTVTSNGFGKCSLVTDYRIQNRGGKGLKLAKITEKTGPVVGARQVKMEDDIMLIVKSGKIIRISVSEIPVLGRDTQGVKLMNTGEDKIISIAVVKED
ncbi:MAG: DNA gyrase subunit A, partial [Deferribacterales bacterium]|nr:DNA gyrase subunit A [Deferribacterales bacterium]